MVGSVVGGSVTKTRQKQRRLVELSQLPLDTLNQVEALEVQLPSLRVRSSSSSERKSAVEDEHWLVGTLPSTNVPEKKVEQASPLADKELFSPIEPP